MHDAWKDEWTELSASMGLNQVNEQGCQQPWLMHRPINSGRLLSKVNPAKVKEKGLFSTEMTTVRG